MTPAFGEAMRQLMAERGVSLRGLAKIVHYDVGGLSKVSRDLKPVSPEMARALDDALGADGQLAALAPSRPRLWRPPSVPDTLNGAFSPDDEQRLLMATEKPARVDAGVIDALGTVLAGQRRLEDAIGPGALVVPVGAQLRQITAMLRDTTGPHRELLGRIVAEWTAYTGWLHAAVRRDAQAVELYGRAEEIADDFADGTIAQIATSFRGYVARQQGRHRAVVRASCAAMATPGGHPMQKTFDIIQAAQGYAALGEEEHARRLLDEAAERAGRATEPPPPVYWYSEPFFRLNIGMALVDLGQYRDAAAMLAAGLEQIPADQRDAEWMAEYKEALTAARDRS